MDIIELLSEAFTMSKSEVRRKIKEGAFKVDGKKIESIDFECSESNLHNKIVQFGKRKFRKFIFDPETNDFQIWG